MKLFDHPFFADENLHPDVVYYLREQGQDVLSVREEGLAGQSDSAVLNFAYQSKRVVLTHDSDFGALAIVRQEPVTGIVYLRPGHIQPAFTIQTLAAIKEQVIEVNPPFLVTAVRKGQTVHIRVRQLEQ